MSDVREATDRAHAGGPQRHHEKSEQQGKLPVRERVARLLDADSFVEDGLLANWDGDGPRRRRRGHRHRDASTAGRSPSWPTTPRSRPGRGGPDGREDHAHPGEGASASRMPDGLPGRLGRRAHHRPDRHVPRPPRRGADLLQPGPHVRRRAAGLRAVRAQRGGRRLHPGVLRRRDHGRRATRRCTWARPRMAEMVIGEKVTLEEMGGAQDALRGLAACGDFLVQTDEEAHRRRPRATWPTSPATGSGCRRRQARRPARRTRRSPRSCPPTRTSPSTCATLLDALVDEGSFFEVHKRWAQRADRRLRAARRPRRSASSPTSPKFKGGVLFVDSADKAARFIWTVRRVQHPAAVPGRRARLHDRHRGRARRASSATARR